MKIIAFSGKMGSGKTEAAKLIALMIEELGYRAVVIKFADPIYKIMQSQCDVLHLDFDKPRMRPIMQFIGEHYRKEYGENFWVERWEMEVKHAEMFKPRTGAFTFVDGKTTYLTDSKEAIYLVDDLRYPNEARKIASLGGKIISVEASDASRRNRITVVGAEHASEQGINHSVDYVVHNNGTIEELKSQLTTLLESIYAGYNQR